MLQQQLSNAIAHFKAGRQVAAVAACEGIAAADPDYPEALHLLGIINFRSGQIAKAGELIGQAVKLKPDYSEAWNNLGHVWRSAGNGIEAISAYEQAGHHDPANAQFACSLGIALHEQGRAAEAVSAFRRAVEYRPDYVEALNRLGSALRDCSQLDEAIATFVRLIELRPEIAELHNNLGVVLVEAGQLHDAIPVFKRVLAIDPARADAHVGLGSIYRQQGKLDAALQEFRHAVTIEPALAEIHLAIYAIAQALGDKPLAVAHQALALKERRLFSELSATPQAARNILILSAPGDWQANIPTDFLFDKTRNNLHTFYLFDRMPDQTAIANLPPFDLVFNAIAEPDKVRPNLLLADRFIALANKPALNDPKLVMKTTRDSVTTILGQIDHCAIPKVRRAARQDLLQASRPQFLRDRGIRAPFLVRPAGAHAGDDLVKIGNANEVDRYLETVAASEFYVTDFVNYCSSDGYYRKYRFIFIGGTPYPFHMAISKNWMVHYYNAEMGANSWKRSEESRFLADYTAIFDSSLQRALGEIGKAIGLDYFGVDCSITADNRLLIFEVDVGMIVHLIDPPDMYAYKHQYVPRITRAFEELIAARLASNQEAPRRQ